MVDPELFKVMGSLTHRGLVEVLHLQLGWVAGLHLNQTVCQHQRSLQMISDYLKAGIMFGEVAVRLPDGQERTGETLAVLCQHSDPWVSVNGDAGIVNVNPPELSAWRISITSVATEDLVSRDIRHVEIKDVLRPEVMNQIGFQQYP